MKLYLASANRHKVRELQALADASRGVRVQISSAADLGGMPAVVEDAGTFLGNAEKKVLALAGRIPEGAWALADDSGICVDALGGAPGVESAYYAGPQSDDAANLAKLIREMAGVPDSRRQAHYVCVLVAAGPGGIRRAFEGSCAGRLIREPRGSGGFGYDPLFVPEGFDATMAEVSPEEKNRISHRGRAWAQCAAWLAAEGQTVLG